MTTLLSLCLIALTLTAPLKIYAAETPKNKVGLMILLDMSSSTRNHRRKFKNLAPLIKKAMENSQCDFKIGVGNIAYNDLNKNDLTPWGEPAFVTMETPHAENLIWQRISDPESVLFPNGTISGDDETPRGSAERTYSSMVEAVEQNKAALEDTTSLGMILVTDAAPAYEIYTPREALQKIRQTLGNRPFIPAMIRPQLSHHMMMEVWDFNTPASESQKSICRLDIPGSQVPGNKINTNDWVSKDIEAMDVFIQEAWGEKWNVCDENYDKSLEDYLQLVLTLSECQLMM